MHAEEVVREFMRGARRSIPIIIAIMPFGLLFGTLAVKHGLSVQEAILMSTAIYAGASQMVGLELFGQSLAPWLIILSILAVNFRHVLYSAALGRRIGRWSGTQKAIGFFFLTDPQFAETERKGIVSFAWYMGFALPVYVAWIGETFLGALFGRLIPNPEALGLDFLLSIYFLGLVLEFRHRPRWFPIVMTSGAASVLAFDLIGSPWHVTAGAAVGIALAASLPTPSGGDRRQHGMSHLS